MKTTAGIFLFTVIQLIAHAQTINFNSYAAVTNPGFKDFLSLFDQKTLPISGDDIIATMDIWHLNKAPLTEQQITTYLTDQSGLIPGALYIEEPADNLPGVPVNGKIYPLYKLPTNGNYVLLVFAQVSDKGEMDCSGLVFTLSYDLQGNFLYFTNYTYEPGREYVNGYIDSNLQSHHIYVVYRVNGELVFPPTNSVFSAKQVHMTYQINSNGLSTEISMTDLTGQFQYSPNECRFKKIN